MGGARYLEADRSQLRWDMVDLESQLPSDHRARVVWAFVQTLNLSDFYAAIGSRSGEPGRPPADPAILLALWLFATLEGVGSARQVDRLCARDVAYRWLCGGVSVNYHGLSDFRVAYERELDKLLSESVAALLAEGLVVLDEVVVDGTKIKASAGRGSFKGGVRLARLEQAARDRVRALKDELESDPGAGERRRTAARERAAREMIVKAQAARARLETLRAEKKRREKRHKTAEKAKPDPQASLSDPEARMMRFPDGAIRPAFNVQIATTSEGAVILGVEVTDRRNDAGLAGPMVEQIENRYGRRPKRLLADTLYATKADVTALARGPNPVEIYAPLPKTSDKPPARPRREGEAIRAWRERMANPQAEEWYRRRRRIEPVFGTLKARGLAAMLVRGMAKVRCVLLLQALAQNLWRGHCLRPATA